MARVDYICQQNYIIVIILCKSANVQCNIQNMWIQSLFNAYTQK